MFNTGGTLKHLAFFEELAGLEQSDPQWRAVSAGLVVLRLLDAWIQDGPRVATADAWGVRSVLSAVEDMPDGDPARSILTAVVEGLQDGRVVDFHSLAPRLIAYAQSLEYTAKWSLAADVYNTILAHTHPIDDSDVAVAAHLRLGQCFRNLNDVSAAADAFQSAGRVANAVGDIVGVLRARIGEARIAINRGNLPVAEDMLEQTIAAAEGPALQDVRSRALHDRAHVAHLRGDIELSIRLAYEALEISASPSERDRILNDIAFSFMDLGVFSAARDAYLVLSATAQEQYVRWSATINLLHIAWLEGRELAFDSYRRELSRETLPALLGVEYLLVTGRGYHRLGHLQQARTHLERGLALAAEHRFNQLVFETEASIRELSRDIVATRAAVSAASLNLEEIAGAIREMREAGVS